MPDNEIVLITKLRDNISGKLGGIGRSMQKFGKTAMVAAAAIAAFGAGLVAATRKIAEYGAAIYDGEQVTRVGIERQQAYAYAFVQTGGSAESFTNSMRGLTTFLRTANTESSEGGRLIKQLGLNYEEIMAMGADELFLSLADSLAGMTSETEQMTAAATIFGGRYSQQVLSLIRQSDGDVRNLLDQFDALGAALSTDQVTALKKFDDAWTDLNYKLKALTADTLVPMTPIIQAGAMELAKMATDILPKLTPAIEATINAMKTGLPVVIGLLGTVAEGWASLLAYLDGYSQINDELTQGTKDLSDILADATVKLDDQGEQVISNTQALGTLISQIEASSEAVGWNSETVVQNMSILRSWMLGTTQAAAQQRYLAGELVNTRDQVIAQAQSFLDSVPAITAFAGAISTILDGEAAEPTVPPVDVFLGTDEEMETKKEHWAELLDELAAIAEEKEEELRTMRKETAQELAAEQIAAQEAIDEKERQAHEARIAAINSERAARTAALQNAIGQARSFGLGLFRAGIQGKTSIDRWFDNFKNRLLDIVSMAAFNTVLNFLTGGGSGIFGSILGAFGFQAGTGQGGIPHAQAGLEIQGTGLLGDRHLVMAEAGEVITPRQKVIQDRYLQGPKTSGAMAVTVNSFIATGSQAEWSESGRIIREILDREGITFNG